MRVNLCAALVAGSLLVSGAASAQSVTLASSQLDPLTGENLPSSGVVTKIMRAAFERAGYTVEMRWVPWKRAEHLVQSGAATGTFPYYKTQERQQTYSYTREPVYESALHLVVAADNVGRWSNVAELAGTSFCYPEGWALSFENATFERLRETGEIELVKPLDMERCLQFIARGRADFTWLGRLITESLTQAALDDPDRVARDPDFIVHRSKFYFIVAKDNDQALARQDAFESGLAELRADGTYDQILADYVAQLRN